MISEWLNWSINQSINQLVRQGGLLVDWSDRQEVNQSVSKTGQSVDFSVNHLDSLSQSVKHSTSQSSHSSFLPLVVQWYLVRQSTNQYFCSQEWPKMNFSFRYLLSRNVMRRKKMSRKEFCFILHKNHRTRIISNIGGMV